MLMGNFRQALRLIRDFPGRFDCDPWNTASRIRAVSVALMLMTIFFSSPQTRAAGGVEQWRQQWKGTSTTGAVEQFLLTAAGVDRYGDIYTLAHGQLAKFSGANGQARWTQSEFNRFGVHRYEALSMSIDPAGFLAVAKSYSGSIRVAKHSANTGHLVWDQEFWNDDSTNDWVNSVAIDLQGNVLAAGYSQLTSRQVGTVIKYGAADGQVLWRRSYVGKSRLPDFTDVRSVRADRDGDVAVTGYSYDHDHFGSLFVAKFRGADGVLVWDRRYGNESQLLDAVIGGGGPFLEIDPSEDIIVAGPSEYVSPLPIRYLVSKCSSADGELLWRSGFGTTGTNDPRVRFWGAQIGAIGLDERGNVVVAGGAKSSSPGTDLKTQLYAGTNGATFWSQIYERPGSSVDQVQGLAVDRCAMVYTSGAVRAGGKFSNYVNIAYAPDGRPEWTNQFAFALSADGVRTSMLLGGGGAVYGLFSGVDSNGVTRHWTVKYSSEVDLGQRIAAKLVQRDFYHPVRTNEIVPFDQYLLSANATVSEGELGCYLRSTDSGFIPELSLIRSESVNQISTARASNSGSAVLLLVTNRRPERPTLLVSTVESTGAGPYELGVYPVIRPRQAVAGELALSDRSSTNRTAAVGNGLWYYDDYLLQGLSRGDRVSVTVNASGFEPFVEVRLLSDETVQHWWQEGATHVWTIQGTAEGVRDYLIRVTSKASDALGPYSMSVERAALNPEIWSFAPTSGSPGTWVTVRGTNFLDGPNPNMTGVLFGGTNAASLEPVVGDGWHEFLAIVPVDARTGPISVLRQDQVVATSTDVFTVLAPIGNVRRETGGRMSFAVSNAIAGVDYVIEATEALNSPIAWTAVQTNALNSPGVWRFTNSVGGVRPERYYRVNVR